MVSAATRPPVENAMPVVGAARVIPEPSPPTRPDRLNDARRDCTAAAIGAGPPPSDSAAANVLWVKELAKSDTGAMAVACVEEPVHPVVPVTVDVAVGADAGATLMFVVASGAIE